jgi:hypothetical protein
MKTLTAGTYLNNDIHNEEQLQKDIDAILMQAIHENVHEIFCLNMTCRDFCLKFKKHSKSENKGDIHLC